MLSVRRRNDNLASPMFRDLYTRLRLTQAASNQIVAVTSAIDGEGKTTIALQLARTVSEDLAAAGRADVDQPVLIVNCNPRSDELSDDLGVPPRPGLVQLLREDCTIDEAASRSNIPGLWYLPAGGTHDELSILLRSSDIDEIRKSLIANFRLAVLDLPSVLTTSDAELLAGQADQIIVVVRAGSTPSPMIQTALKHLDRERIAGLVLNDKKSELPGWLERRL